MTISRRRFMQLSALAGAGAVLSPLLAGCNSSEETASEGSATTNISGNLEKDVLKVGYLPITDAAPLLLAHGMGAYEKNGLSVEKPTLMRSWNTVAEAFQSKQVDIVHLLMPMAVWLRFSKNFPLKLIAWDHMDGSALTVKDNINSVSELAGTTVAIPYWYSIHNVVLQKLLRKEGLTPLTIGNPSKSDRTVKLIVMPPPDMPVALSNNSISGYIVADPFNAVAEVNNIGKVLRFTGDVWYKHACCVAVMHEDDVTNRPNFTQAVVNSIAEAQLYATNNKVEAAKLLSKDGGNYLPQPLKAIEHAMTHYDHNEYVPSGAITHPDWDNERIGFQPFPFPSYTEELIKSLRETVVEGDNSFLEKLDPKTAHQDLVNDSFAKAAIQKLGGTGKFNIPEDYTRTELIKV
ncbi:MAG: ABC transporter substrate-binding protein [Chloroflexi bacterium]|nr:ABC transporter substrate-binding protein [Chloroflexota bacterium]